MLIELEIGHVDNRPHGRVHDDADRVRDAVADVEELHGEAPQGQPVIGGDGVQLAVGQQPGFLQLELGQPARERGGVNRHIQILQQVRQRADVVLMAVGQHDRLHPVGAFGQVGDVRVYQINPEHVALGKHQPGVDHQDVPVVLQCQQILADLAEAAKRHDAKW